MTSVGVLKTTWPPQMPMPSQSILCVCESHGGLGEQKPCVFSPELRLEGEILQWGGGANEWLDHLSLSPGDTSEFLENY